ncbi:MAG: hypothetical protein WA771_11530 [Chthoniobacterales bacterium]
MSEPDPQLADRATRAARIIASPDGYKVCEGCESIVARHVTVCPNCHGYRFEGDPESVASQARHLGSRPQTTVTADDLE